MSRTHNFVASKDQYENQFRKRWKWEKNMTSDEWKYVAKRLKERGDRPTTVLFRQKPVPPEKVKKKIRIYDLPTFIPYKPKGSDRVIVRTPPHTSPRLLSPVDSQMILTRKRPLQQSSTHDMISTVSSPIPKRIQLDSIALPPHNAVTWEPQHGMAILENNLKTISLPDLDDLPFFKLQAFMRSPEFRCGFEQLIALNNNYNERSWSRLATAHSDDPFTISDDMASSAESELEEVECLIPYLPPSNVIGQTHTSFATSLFNISNRNRSIKALPQAQLHSTLASFPRRSIVDFSDTMEQLLGPPTIEAALRYVELGIYMCSNNLGNVDNLSRWMIQTIPWSSLKPLFRKKLRSLQAFSERFLATAVELAKVTIVRDLLEPSIHQNLIDHVQASERVLCKAAQSDNIELVALILSVGANPNAKSDKYGDGTPLCFARSVQVAELLVKAGADPDCIGRYPGMSESPLIQAVCAGNVPVARCLISVQANVNTRIEMSRGKSGSPRFVSALSVAVDRGDLDMVELLLGAGAEVNVFCCSYDCSLLFAPDGSHLVHPYDYEGSYMGSDIICTPLQAAAMLGHGHIARLLLDHCSDVNARSAVSLAMTALQAATSACHVDLVRLLLQRGADVNIPVPREGNTSTSFLHMAVDLNHLELVNIFLDANANVNAQSLGKYGCSIMESAKLCTESGAIIQALVARGASEVQVPLLRCRLELRDAVWDGDFEKVEALYASGVQINMELIPGDLPQDPEPGCRVYSQTGTILHYAIYDWHNTPSRIDMFQFLVDRVGDINIHNQNLRLTPILHLAIKIGDMDLIRILLDAGVDTNTIASVSWSEHYVSPLCLAAGTYDLSLISLLIDHGADINLLIGDRSWVTALQHLLWHCKNEEDISIVSERRPAVVKLMLERGALLDTYVPSAQNKQTELVMAVRTGDLELVVLLLDHGADVNFFPRGIGRLSPLQAAAKLSPPSLEIFYLLISKGADINAPAAIEEGFTALQAAAWSGNFEIARYLLEAGVDVNAVGPQVFYRTALEAAIFSRRLDIVYLLLQAGSGLYIFGGEEEQDVKAADFAGWLGGIAITEMIEEWIGERGLE